MRKVNRAVCKPLALISLVILCRIKVDHYNPLFTDYSERHKLESSNSKLALNIPLPYIALFVGVLSVSTAAIFIRLAQGEGAASLVIAAGRLVVASVVLTPIVFTRHRTDLKHLTRKQIGLALLGGVILALHFAAWITSLEYTSVTVSVVLVTTNALWVAVLSAPLLGESVRGATWVGIAMAFGGGFLVAVSGESGDPPTRAAPLLGSGLATLGAIMAALYFIVGRRLRSKVSVITYIWLVYTAAAMTLMIVLALLREPITGYSTLAYVWIIAMGLIPQLIGHSSFNYALGHLSAAFVSLAVLGEPIGSTILAIVFLNELPGLLAVIGSTIILSGIAYASLRRTNG